MATKKRTSRWAFLKRVAIVLVVVFFAFYVLAEPHTFTNAFQGVMLLVCAALAVVLVYRAMKPR